LQHNNNVVLVDISWSSYHLSFS